MCTVMQSLPHHDIKNISSIPKQSPFIDNPLLPTPGTWCNQLSLYFAYSRIPHNRIIQCVVYYVWLLSLGSNSFEIHPFCCTYQQFLAFIAEQYSTLSIYHNLFIYSPGDGHLEYFQILAILNKTALRIHVQSLYESVFILWGKYLGVKFLGHSISMYLTL